MTIVVLLLKIAAAGFALIGIAVVSVAIGATIARFFAEKWTRIIASVLFVATGIWLIADGLAVTFLGVRL